MVIINNVISSKKHNIYNSNQVHYFQIKQSFPVFIAQMIRWSILDSLALNNQGIRLDYAGLGGRGAFCADARADDGPSNICCFLILSCSSMAALSDSSIACNEIC